MPGKADPLILLIMKVGFLPKIYKIEETGRMMKRVHIIRRESWKELKADPRRIYDKAFLRVI
jgi:hypothetical protein